MNTSTELSKNKPRTLADRLLERGLPSHPAATAFSAVVHTVVSNGSLGHGLSKEIRKQLRHKLNANQHGFTPATLEEFQTYADTKTADMVAKTENFLAEIIDEIHFEVVAFAKLLQRLQEHPRA